jgi:catechol 2,3-dioxygenase-like lactoylglutathione lyase family enzyme
MSLSAVAMAPTAVAQPTSKPHIALKTLNHVTLNVSDVERSLKFYQALFGMRNYAPQGATPLLEIGTGPYSLGLRRRAPGEPNFSHITLGVEDFNADQIMKTLAAHGVARTETATTEPMKAWVRRRGETPELFFTDPGGIPVQVQAVSYCGGSGVLGNKCPPPANEMKVQPSKAPLRVQTINHHLILVSNPGRSKKFWQELFDMKGGDGPAGGRGNPLLVGPGPQWMGFTPGKDAKPSLDHVCLGMENFEPDGVLTRLADFGLKRSEISPPEAFSTRYANSDYQPLTAFPMWRSGARDGSDTVRTAEVFLTDPDNITIQVNDVNYCSGFGRLGNVCP